ncbi:MAG: hypothetical protein ACLQPD_06495 [Desulfomonilaceae bacterium]
MGAFIENESNVVTTVGFAGSALTGYIGLIQNIVEETMLREDSSKIDPRDWSYKSLTSKDAELLVNEAPVDRLLFMFYSAAQSGTYGPNESDFMEMLLTGRYIEASIKGMDRLTEAINNASKTSTWVGIGLVVFAAAQVFVALWK